MFSSEKKKFPHDWDKQSGPADSSQGSVWAEREVKKLCICVRLQNGVGKQDTGLGKQLGEEAADARLHQLLGLIILFALKGS